MNPVKPLLPPPRFINFAKYVGIVCGAAIASWTIISATTGWAWGLATTPILTSISEERRSRAAADSVIINRLEEMNGKFKIIGIALQYPPGSRLREKILAPLKETE